MIRFPLVSMEGNNFVLPGTKRVPSIFAAGCLYFLAVAGKPLTELGQWGLGLLAARFGLEVNTSLLSSVSTLAYYLLFVLLPLLLYARRHAGIGEYMRFKPLKWDAALIAVGGGVVGFFLCIGANYFWCMFIETLGGTIPGGGSMRANNNAELVALIAGSAILPAVCEESLFRGAILGALDHKGPRRAILLTAMMFMLMHSSVAGMPAELISGLVLGLVVVLSGSVFTGIVYHTVHNAMAIMMSNLSLESSATAAQSYYEALGSSGGVIALGFVTLTMLIGMALLLMLLKKRYGSEVIKKRAIRGEETGTCEWTVYTCAFVLALALYAPDILTVVLS